MNEAEKRMHRICFTGHRPELLTRTGYAVKKDLRRQIRRCVADGYSVFISGMARGVDIWAAQEVLKLRTRGAAVRLICACPYEGCEREWSKAWQRRYHRVLCAADLVRYICPDYCPTCFRARNEWMVDHAAAVIAVFNGSPGGTKNTVTYARKKGVPITFIKG